MAQDYITNLLQAPRVGQLWKMLQVIGTGLPQRFTDAHIWAKLMIVYNPGPGNVLFGPDENLQPMLVAPGTTYLIPTCGIEFDLYDWWAVLTLNDQVDVYYAGI